jgi:histidyl-tRNA synthetase
MSRLSNIVIRMTEVRTPLGTIDLNENDILIRNHIFEVSKKILKLRGATQIETPIMEMFNMVDSLYGGEFNKLVYTLDDDNHNKLFLRYDLTIPLARYIGMNGLIKFRRFQFGKVYRKDDPQIHKGRFREFYQFDYDIVGDDQKSGINDMEIVETLNEILSALLGVGTFTIKFNYKNIVIKMIEKCGISKDLHKCVFSALDKLDKKEWHDVEIELLQKGLSPSSVYNLRNCYNKLSNYDKLDECDLLDDDVRSNLATMLKFIDRLNLKNIILDPFLIRGMDYYTGILFEVTYNNKEIMASTISAGGRYDNMLSNFSTRGIIPAIGMSLGVDRITKILEKTNFKIPNENSVPDIYVASIGENMIIERVALCNEFRRMGYYTVMSDLSNPKMRSQFTSVFEDYGKNIPIMVVIGQNEIKNNTLTIKDINADIQTNMGKQEAFSFIKEKLGK